MMLLHSSSFNFLPINVSVLWLVQFACSLGVLLTLPRNLWPFRILFAVSALADIAEYVIPNGTQMYAHIYWGFRIAELLILVAGSCFLAGQYFPRLGDMFHTPMWCAFAVTVGNGIPQNNLQMQIYQESMLLIAVAVLWLALFLRWGLRLFLLAMAMLFLAGLELLCTAIWRYHVYNTEMWFIVWITGALMVWLAQRDRAGDDRRPAYPSL